MLPTANLYAANGPDYALICGDCPHTAVVDYAEIIAAGKGDVPLIDLRFVCAKCGSRNVSGVVSGARRAGY